MHDKRHAITLLGHGPLQKDVPLTSEGINVRFSFDRIGTFIMHDDNYLMYQLLGKGQKHELDDVSAFVVPLPERVYLSSEAVLVHVIGLFEQNKLVDFSYIENKIVRHFITTSYSLKAFTRNRRAEIPVAIFGVIMELTMPKFVWIVEVADTESAGQEKCLVRMVFDATASRLEETPFFLVHDNSVVQVYDRMLTKRRYEIPLPADRPTLMSNYEHNLTRVCGTQP